MCSDIFWRHFFLYSLRLSLLEFGAAIYLFGDCAVEYEKVEWMLKGDEGLNTASVFAPTFRAPFSAFERRFWLPFRTITFWLPLYGSQGLDASNPYPILGKCRTC